MWTVPALLHLCQGSTLKARTTEFSCLPNSTPDGCHLKFFRNKATSPLVNFRWSWGREVDAFGKGFLRVWDKDLDYKQRAIDVCEPGWAHCRLGFAKHTPQLTSLTEERRASSSSVRATRIPRRVI